MNSLEQDIDNTLAMAKTTGLSVTVVAVQTWLEKIHDIGNKRQPWILDKINHWIKYHITRLSPHWITTLVCTVSKLRYMDAEILYLICNRVRSDVILMSTDQLVLCLLAFASIGYYDSNTFDVVTNTLLCRELDRSHISKILKSMALFNTINNELMTEIYSKVNNISFTAKQSICVMWSLAVLDVRHIRTYKNLLKLVTGPLTQDSKSMLHSVYVWLHYCLKCHFPIKMPKMKTFKSQPSKYQLEIAEGLKELGYNPVVEAEIKHISVDVLLPKETTIFEFDGPSHWLYQTREPTGRSVIKRRNLIGIGYTVFVIGYFDWPANKKEQIEYLRQLMA